MRESKNEFYAFLDEQTDKTISEANALAADDRKDEANTLKAKANIYDIFKAIWNAAEKTTDNEEDFKKTLFGKIEVITTPWGKSLEAAKAHDDVAKIMIEEAKLAAVAEVKAKLDTLA